MMNKVRILSCIVVAIMLFGSISAVWAAEEEMGITEDSDVSGAAEEIKPEAVKEVAAVISDIAGTRYEEAVMLLCELGIVTGDSGGQFYPERNVTRAEAAATVVRLLGLGDVEKAKANEQVYDDVPVGQWYTGYVNLAADLKIISGRGEGIFAPDDNVLWEEYIKMLVSAVGYNEVANVKGGYPSGHFTVAKELKIIRDEAKMGTDIIRGDVAIYAYNALFAELLLTTYTSNYVQYTSSNEGATLIEQIYSIYEKRGIIAANEYTGIDSADIATDKTRVLLEDSNGNRKLYSVGRTNAKEYLGYAVTIYVQNDSYVQDEIKVITLDGNNNEKIEISSEDVVTLEEVSGAVKITYTAGGSNNRSKTVPSSANIVYNNKYMNNTGGLDFAEYEHHFAFSPGMGNVELIDNTNDGIVDVVIVTAAKNYVIDRIYSSTYTLSMKGSGRIDLDIGDASYKYVIFKDGEEIAFEDLKEGDVVTYIKSSDDEIKILYVTEGEMKGTVTEVLMGLDGTVASQSEYNEYGTMVGSSASKIYLDGTEYVLSYDANKVPGVGDSIIAYKNVYGAIVYIDLLGNLAHGYMYLVGINNEGGIENGVRAQIVTGDGKLMVVPVKTKVNITESGSTSSITSANLSAKLKNGNMLIKGSVNNDGFLSSVEIAGEPAGRYEEGVFTLDAENTLDYKKMFYRSGAPNRIAGLYAVGKNCVVFMIPDKDKDDGSIDAEKIRVRNDLASLSNDYCYMFNIYDLNKNMTASAIVCYGLDTIEHPKEGALSVNTPLFVFDRYTQFASEDDGSEKKHKITGFINGKETSVILDDDVIQRTISGSVNEPVSGYEDGGTAINKLIKSKRGTIIQYKTNADGNLSEYRIVYDFSIGASSKWSDSSNDIKSAEMQTGYYIVDAIGDGVVVLTKNPGDEDSNTNKVRTLAISENQTVYVYNKTRDKIKVGSIADIVPAYGSLENGSKVFVRIYKDNLQEVIIMED